ncbi:MAG: RNA polymerase sigma factor [Anaerolineae bacterium]
MAATELAETSDSQLAAVARGGGKDAFASLYDRHAAGVYRYARLRVASREEAEDITETVFLRAWQSLPAFRGDCPFAAWLYRIARNAITDHYRTRRVHQPLEDVADSPLRSDSDRDAEVVTVRAALASLPDDQREVLMLRFLEGFSHDEVAASLGKSAAACRVIQHRALKAIGRILGGEK